MGIIPPAAEACCAEEGDIVSMRRRDFNNTVREIEAAMIEMSDLLHGCDVQVARIMLFVVALGPDSPDMMRVSSPIRVARVISRMRETGILCGDEVHAEWLEEHGDFAFMLDVMTVEGLLQRITDEKKVTP